MIARVSNITGFTGKVRFLEDITVNAVSVSLIKRNY
jgi:hypothetical protein